MVPNLTILFLFISGFICFAVPFGLVIILRKNQRGFIGPIVAGIISFVLFQMVIRIPIIQTVLPNLDWYVNSSMMFKFVFLAATAALFETFGRWFTIRFFLKDRYSLFTGIFHGIGHGGIEAIMLVGINMIVYGFMAFEINSNGSVEFMAQFADAGSQTIDGVSKLVTTLIEDNSWLFLVSGYERLMTIAVHLGLSVLVMQGFAKNKVLLYSLIAFIIHFLLDFGSVAMYQNGVNLLLVEGYVTLIAIGLIVYIFKSKFEVIEAKIENQELIDSEY